MAKRLTILVAFFLLMAGTLVGCGTDEGEATTADSTANTGDTNNGEDPTEDPESATLVFQMETNLNGEAASLEVVEPGVDPIVSPIRTGEQILVEVELGDVCDWCVDLDGFKKVCDQVTVQQNPTFVDINMTPNEVEQPVDEYPWENKELTCDVNGIEDATENNCHIDDSDMLTCTDGFNPTPISDPGITLTDRGFVHVFRVNTWDCHLPD